MNNSSNNVWYKKETNSYSVPCVTPWQELIWYFLLPCTCIGIRIYCWCTDSFVHGSNSTGKKNDPCARRASDNHIKGVPGIKPNVRQSKTEGVIALQSPFHPCFCHLYHRVIFCTKSYYIIYFDLLPMQTFPGYARDLWQIPKKSSWGPVLLSRSDTTMIQAPPVKRHWAQGSH